MAVRAVRVFFLRGEEWPVFKLQRGLCPAIFQLYQKAEIKSKMATRRR